MLVFATLIGLEGSSYVRLPSGTWIKGWPGMSLWQEVPPTAKLKDPDKVVDEEHLVDEEFAEKLEAELARIRRKGERSSAA